MYPKQIALFLMSLWFMPQLSISQVTLEATYPTTNLKRIKLQTSGEKWYYVDDSTRQIHFFNANHSPWKTIEFPKEANKTVSLAPTNMPISQTIFKTDNLMELVWLFKDSTSKIERIKILNELNDSVYYFTEGYNKLTVNELAGSPTKLFVENRDNESVWSIKYQTTVFTLPNMINKKTYLNASEMHRQKFGYAGEKMYFKNASLKRLEIYNANDTLWKSIIIPSPSNGTLFPYDPVFFADDKIFDSDTLVEFAFSYDRGLGYCLSKIVNENGKVLLTANSLSWFKLEQKQGYDDKIFFTDENNVNTQYKVLKLPYPIVVEHSNPYLSPVERIFFKQFGAKYTNYDYGKMILFNNNHTPWRNFNLESNTGYYSTYSQYEMQPFICDSIVNADSLVEIIWTEWKQTSRTTSAYQLRITNENQQKIQTIPDARLFEINQLDNLPTKLITKTWDSTRYTNTKVWRFNTSTATNDPSVLEGLEVDISPNPFNTSFTIHHSDTERPLSIRLFNATGMLILTDKITSVNATLTPKSSLPNGIYFLEISNGIKRTVKRLVKM